MIKTKMLQKVARQWSRFQKVHKPFIDGFKAFIITYSVALLVTGFICEAAYLTAKL